MTFRKATREDVPLIVQMLADDKLGMLRERFADPLPKVYYDAFERIKADPNQELIVVVDTNSEVVGTLQLSHIPGLTFQGGIRTQIEAVRIRSDRRSQGIGEALFRWAIDRAKSQGSQWYNSQRIRNGPRQRGFTSGWVSLVPMKG